MTRVRTSVAAGFVALAAAMALPAVVVGGSDAVSPTAYLAPLEAHRAKLGTLHREIDRLARLPAPQTTEDAKTRAELIRTAGNDYLVEARAFAKTVTAFVNGGTRRGLDREVDTIRTTVHDVLATVDAYRLLSGAKIDKPTARTPSMLEQQLRGVLGQQLARRIPNKLVAEGVRKLIAGTSLQTVVRETLDQARQSAYAAVDSQIRSVTGLGLADLRDLGRALRLRANQEVDRLFTRLIVGVTGNQLVIELFRKFALPWLKAQLTNLMRPRLTLDERVSRSIQSLQNAARSLDRLPADARLSTVHARWQDANAALAATRFLVADIKRAHRESQLLGGLYGNALAELESRMHWTEVRFLLHKEDLVKTLAVDREELHGMLADLGYLTRHVVLPTAGVSCADGLGLVWSEHEVGYAGTWKRSSCTTSTWAVTWKGGCDRSTVTVTRAGSTVTARRRDQCAFSPDFSATYTGKITGRTISGKEQCHCLKAFPCSGSPRTWTQAWDATIVR